MIIINVVFFQRPTRKASTTSDYLLLRKSRGRGIFVVVARASIIRWNHAREGSTILMSPRTRSRSVAPALTRLSLSRKRTEERPPPCSLRPAEHFIL